MVDLTLVADGVVCDASVALVGGNAGEDLPASSLLVGGSTPGGVSFVFLSAIVDVYGES